MVYTATLTFAALRLDGTSAAGRDASEERACG